MCKAVLFDIREAFDEMQTPLAEIGTMCYTVVFMFLRSHDQYIF